MDDKHEDAHLLLHNTTTGSHIQCLYQISKGKGDALERGNYHGLKLTEQVMKVL